jgi:predicted dehydrogenase
MGNITRRKFVTTAAGTGAALTIVPRHVLGHGIQAPSDTVNVAIIGFGMGASNARALMSQNLVAFCDVHDSLMAKAIKDFEAAAAAPPASAQRGGGTARRSEPSKAQKDADARRPAQNGREIAKRFVEQNLPRVQKYRDYRQMLEKQKDIDAVVVATPDHMHAPIASMAMDLGKHVYVQKPLCWSVEEARHLAKKAKDRKIVSQMGNQGHSLDDARTGYEYVVSGAIGEIREVHVWTNRPLGYWPQGVPRPAPLVDDPNRPLGWSGRAVEQRLAAAIASGAASKPDDLDWNLFLGGAPQVEYHPIYHPFNWRGWVDWGQGALGDMGAHLVDHPFWSLNLGYPTTVETLSTPFNGASFPHATTTYYEFPKRGNLPAVKLTWYDGGLLPAKPEAIGDVRLNPGGGLMYIGSKGILIQDTYGAEPRLFPENHPASKTPPPQKLKRIAHQEHEMNWVEAIKGVAEISSPFDYAAPLTEVMLLGIVALRARTKIHYDGANMKITNSVATSNQPLEGEQLLRRQYREGFGLSDTKTL